ncbi:MAG: hypothetical protein KBG15_06275 [Kofleriaceae bacterium]|nr:hypothetical protein [Kofleriaceae bacterium]
MACGLAMLCAAAPALAAACPRWVWATRCCCPDPALCHCPGNNHGHEADEADEASDTGDDHERPVRKAPSLRRCSNTGDMDELAFQVFSVPALLESSSQMVTQPAPTTQATSTPRHRWVFVEVPPF